MESETTAWPEFSIECRAKVKGYHQKLKKFQNYRTVNVVVKDSNKKVNNLNNSLVTEKLQHSSPSLSPPSK